jgi:hypothetical protein
MLHRHLNHQRYTLAAIDDVISRGRWQDWADLRRAVLADRTLLDQVERVCRPYASDPYASAITSGCTMPKSTAPLPDWELVLSSAARLQRILPDAVLVGGTASAIHAGHRFSRDADHVLTDLRHRFDDVLAQLESVAGWKTARVQRPVQILGSLDGIETGVRQLIRDEPLETVVVDYHGARITVPTEGEILRIKALWRVLGRQSGHDQFPLSLSA